MQVKNAQHEWATRPADQRFWTIGDAVAACDERTRSSVEKEIAGEDLRAEVIDGDVALVGRAGVPASLTHYSFGQLAHRAGAPAEYLRELPATLAAQNLNHGLKANQATKVQLLLQRRDTGLTLRAATSERYARFFDSSLMSLLHCLEDAGWVAPPGWLPWGLTEAQKAAMPTRLATAEDARASLRVKEGDTIVPSGIYVSDRDSFVFLVHPDRVVSGGDADTALMRGMIAWNSEVGARSLGIQTFLFDGACGNHAIIGARDLAEFSARHIGDGIAWKFRDAMRAVEGQANAGTAQIETAIRMARTTILGATRDDALDKLVSMARGKGLQTLSRKRLSAAMDTAEQTPRYGDPKSLWGVFQGLTEGSQEFSGTMDARYKVDREAGRLLDVVF